MCGIVGEVGPYRRSLEHLRAMRDTLAHRGPDASGEHVSGDAFIGVRRLRIIDLVGGDQPIANEDGSVWAVHNGEIYNFRELRRELEMRGHRFSTQTDTEVIVHAYEEFRDDTPRRLEGMFAIAVFDERERRLLLARDRLGKKPLLYATPRPDTLAFASEFAAILADPDVDRSIDAGALELYLSLGYIPAPLTIYRGVSKLLPAHLAVWERGRLEARPYWTLPEHGTAAIDKREEATGELIDRLRRAVRSRLVADVPIGAFLSGGVDSSLVVAIMAQETASVRTFSIGFDEADYSELQHARRVAARYGTEHHEMLVRPDLVSVAPLLARHYGEPYADSSAVPLYYLSKLTREHVTVALSGDGGDEMFAGYDRYRAMRLAAALHRILPHALRPLAAVGKAALRGSAARRGTMQRAYRFLEAATLPEAERYLSLVGIFTGVQKDTLFTADVPRLPGDVLCLLSRAMAVARDPAERANAADLRSYLPDDLLVKVDIVSMANSLEVRAPFLDRAVVEFGVALPIEWKVREGTGKYILKKAAEAFVPRENLYRPKTGFGLPIGDWFRGDLRGLINDTVLSPQALQRGYFRSEAVRSLVMEHERCIADHSGRIWALLMFELWHREFIDRR